MVGNVSARVKWDEHIRLPGVNHLDVRAATLHIASEGQCHVEVDVFFLGERADGSGIVSAVSGIDDQCEAVGGDGLQGGRHHGYQ